MTKLPILLIVLLLHCAHASAAPTILVFGDSLSAAHGIAVERSWPALLQDKLRRDNFPHAVVNASISGETTAGGRSRLPAVLKRHQPALVILALGANDGLRGLPLAPMRDNLAAMASAARASGARVLIAGMQLPPNYGIDYARQFADSFAQVARREKAALLPFLLEPIALDDGAYQPDRLHPTAAAQARILDHVWRQLNPLLKPR